MTSPAKPDLSTSRAPTSQMVKNDPVPDDVSQLIGGSITWIVLGLQNNSEPSEQVAVRARVGLGTLQLSGSF